jgi:putative hydrolase of the HAD superfamily
MSKHSSNTIQVITFDLDDTLWDIRPVLVRAETAVYRWLQQNAPRLSEHYSPEQLAQLKLQVYRQQPELAHQISELRRVALRHALLACDYSERQAQELATAAFEVFIDARHQVSLFDGAEPVLAALQQHYQLGVLTNGNADIRRLPIGRYFDFAFSAEQLNASKPGPNHFEAALNATGCMPEQLVHVGDHPEHDVEGAMAVGCHGVWYNPHGQTWPNQQAASGEISQ